MSLAHAIAPHLPYLRRYARALTGTQAEGDAQVKSCLESIVDDPTRISRDLPPRVALYRTFHRVREEELRSGASLRGAASEGEGVVAQKLSLLTPANRQALLLTTMEGFSDTDAGHILQIPAHQVRDMVQEAIREMTAHPGTSVLIMEDEPVISLDLSSIVEEMGHNVEAVAVTRTDALKAAQRSWPGLILADIQLADGSSGIDAVNDILKERPVPVIFITAYPERLLTGERPEPAFLVTKPFTPQTVKAAISQALFLSTAEARADV